MEQNKNPLNKMLVIQLTRIWDSLARVQLLLRRNLLKYTGWPVPLAAVCLALIQICGRAHGEVIVTENHRII